jgi:predicted amidophosphoribosyltransferase
MADRNITIPDAVRGDWNEDRTLYTGRETARKMGELVETKNCPDCAEPIREAAKVCRHCGYKFPRSA